MTELLLAALERLPSRIRRVVVAIGALLALGAVMAALTLTNPHGGHKRRAPAAASRDSSGSACTRVVQVSLSHRTGTEHRAPGITEDP